MYFGKMFTRGGAIDEKKIRFASAGRKVVNSIYGLF